MYVCWLQSAVCTRCCASQAPLCQPAKADRAQCFGISVIDAVYAMKVEVLADCHLTVLPPRRCMSRCICGILRYGEQVQTAVKAQIAPRFWHRNNTASKQPCIRLAHQLQHQRTLGRHQNLAERRLMSITPPPRQPPVGQNTCMCEEDTQAQCLSRSCLIVLYTLQHAAERHGVM